MISSWSRQQTVVALSSAEAELYSAAMAVSEGLYIQRLMKEITDQEFPLRLFCDSSAAIGIIHAESSTFR